MIQIYMSLPCASLTALPPERALWLTCQRPPEGGVGAWGSPFGWLVTFGGKDLEFSLVNPFSRTSLPLPSLQTLIAIDEYDPNKCFTKAFLMASPSSLDFLVLVLINPSDIYTNKEDFILGFAKPAQDKAWSLIEGLFHLHDIVSFKGNLCGAGNDINGNTRIVQIQIKQRRPVGFSTPLNLPGIDDQAHEKYCYIEKYLVVLDGELCLVLHFIIMLPILSTLYFKILKVDMSTKKWTPVRLLGDQCLFLGNNYTFTCKGIPPLFEQFKRDATPDNYRSNYIYYGHDDDLYPLNRDVGVFDIKHRVQICRNLIAPNTNPPVWITPSLQISEGLGKWSLSKYWLKER
ncbi:F-box protein [Quillaja saponaria]|uniref:F-box protein n=1 Tax=Quillaja saponaria TaxID=32244 RepID=A0AAD7LG76_QUISA|nr:F-box protein [Quillaja saponaria]KAJ7957606.1 F-box protein [Quillaja saponaria]